MVDERVLDPVDDRMSSIDRKNVRGAEIRRVAICRVTPVEDLRGAAQLSGAVCRAGRSR
jgi:hypothetical protein